MKVLHRLVDVALAEMGKGNVMVLFPSRLWDDVISQLREDKPENVWLRRSDYHANLRSLPVKTLILVAAGDPDWDETGLELAKGLLAGQLDPKIISIDRDGEVL